MPSNGCSNYDSEQWHSSDDLYKSSFGEGGVVVAGYNPTVDFATGDHCLFAVPNHELGQLFKNHNYDHPLNFSTMVIIVSMTTKVA